MKKAIQRFARQMKSYIKALYFAGRDSRTPMVAKFLAIVVVAYALSPIDLIPDFIPVLGYLDDVILLPAGIYLTVKLIPNHLWQEFLTKADQSDIQLPKNQRAVIVISSIWCLGLAIAGLFIFKCGFIQRNV